MPSVEVEFFELDHVLQVRKSCVGNSRTTHTEYLHFRQPGHLCQPDVGDARTRKLKLAKTRERVSRVIPLSVTPRSPQPQRRQVVIRRR